MTAPSAAPVRPTPDVAPAALEALGLHKRYTLGGETVHALRGVDLVVRSGEFVAVMGPSGSGKSTLLHLLGLLDAPDAGTIALAGAPTAGLDDDALTDVRRRRLGFVFQAFELVPNLTARENVLLPAEIAGEGGAAAGRLKELATALGITDRLDHRPDQLSGGQRQRVAIARALINDPVLVLADEPTGNLDSRTGREVLDLLRRGVDDQGWTVVIVTHDAQAALTTDRIVFLRDGAIAGEARTSDDDVRTQLDTFLAG